MISLDSARKEIRELHRIGAISATQAKRADRFLTQSVVDEANRQGMNCTDFADMTIMLFSK